MLASAVMLTVALAGALGMDLAHLDKEASLHKLVAVSALWLADLFTSAAPNRSIVAIRSYLGILVLAFSLFAFSAWIRTDRKIKSAWLDTGLFALQILIGALVESDLLYLVAAELAFILPLRKALAWLCGLMLTFVASTIPILMHAGVGTPRCNVAGIFPPPAIVPMGLDWVNEIAFQIFAFCVGYFARAEMQSRLTLASTYGELAATQVLLEDAVRASEKERIACDLHVAIGTQLTALCRHLNLAAHHADAHIAESIAISRKLAQRLLIDIRTVISNEYERQPILLRSTLETLCKEIPYPHIVLSYDDQIDLKSSAIAYTIFRVVQEAVSNTMHHSGASLLRIEIAKVSNGLAISITDNGKGTQTNAVAHSGNGLRGIGERIEEHGGTMKTFNRPEGGFSVQIWLPHTEGCQ